MLRLPDRLSSLAAGKIRSLGLGKGDFIPVCMGRRLEYFVAYLGVLKAGAVVVPIVPDYPEERISYICANCDSRLLITEDFLLDIERYDPVYDPADGKEGALLIDTSGSAGEPKGILHSAGDMARARTGARYTSRRWTRSRSRPSRCSRLSCTTWNSSRPSCRAPRSISFRTRSANRRRRWRTTTFTDHGVPFDPRQNVTDPDGYDIDTQVGGLGRLIAFTIADSVEYEYRDGNILTLTKTIKEDTVYDDHQN